MSYANAAMEVEASIHTDPIFFPLNHGHRSSRLVIGCVLVRRKIGEGGMCSVYLGHHLRLNTSVAIKILKRHGLDSVREFLREARLMAGFDHKNLVRIFDVNREHVRFNRYLYYIVMEYVEGHTAFELLHKSLKERGRPIAPLPALEIVASAADALSVVHAQGIVHRDMKPENIVIRKSDGEVKVLDLGLAIETKNIERERERCGTIMGTMGFVAPEILAGEVATPAADVYSLGVTLYELLSGELPFGKVDDGYARRQMENEAPDLRSRVPRIPEVISELVGRCLSTYPSRRFRDCSELAAAAREAYSKAERELSWESLGAVAEAGGESRAANAMPSCAG